MLATSRESRSGRGTGTPHPAVEDLNSLKTIELPLEVEPFAKLGAPTSVAVTVNPTQAELLTHEAGCLTAKAARLIQQFASPTKRDSARLRDSVNAAIYDVGKTEESFRDAGKGEGESEEAAIFFDDIRRNYRRALDSLSTLDRPASPAAPAVAPVHILCLFLDRVLVASI